MRASQRRVGICSAVEYEACKSALRSPTTLGKCTNKPSRDEYGVAHAVSHLIFIASFLETRWMKRKVRWGGRRLQGPLGLVRVRILRVLAWAGLRTSIKSQASFKEPLHARE